jgi:hypothetical protein
LGEPKVERFDELIARLRTRFPWLHIDVQHHHRFVHAIAEIPAQHGLDLRMSASLQNLDELHLTVGDNFWFEWFPCSDDRVFEEYIDAVTGIISGDYRVVERRMFGKVDSAVLEKPSGRRGWHPVARWSRLSSLIPAPRTATVLQNTDAHS